MKYSLALAFALLISEAAFSQKISVKPGPVLTPQDVMKLMGGPKLKAPKHSSIFTGQFFDNVSKKTYTYVGFSGGKLRFIVSDDYVKPGVAKDLSTEVITEGEKETIQLLSFVNQNGRSFIFYSIDFPKADQFSVYVNELSADFVMMGSPVLVHNFKDLKKYEHSVTLQPSANNQNFLLFRDMETKPREPQKFECAVINSQFGEVWSRSFELELKDKELVLQTTDIDNDGNVFVLAEKEVKPDAGPMLYFYGWKDKTFKTMALGLQEGFNFGASLKLINGVPYIAGLNQQKKNVNCIIQRFDIASATMQTLGNTAMPDDFYKASNFNAFETKHWSVSDLISLDNKDVVVAVDARLVKIMNGIPVGYYSYYTFLTIFSENGTLKYQHTIRKMQGSANELVGLALIPYKNNVFAVYNDHPDNLKLSPTEKKVEGYTGMKDAMIMVQQIDATGKVSKYQLTAEAGMKNWSLNLSAMARINDNNFYSTGIIRKSMFSFETRALTFEIIE